MSEPRIMRDDRPTEVPEPVVNKAQDEFDGVHFLTTSAAGISTCRWCGCTQDDLLGGRVEPNRCEGGPNVAAARGDAVYVPHEALDLLAEQVAIAHMQVTDADGRRLCHAIRDLTKHVTAARRAMDAIFGVGGWRPLGGDWPKPEQMVRLERLDPWLT